MHALEENSVLLLLPDFLCCLQDTICCVVDDLLPAMLEKIEILRCVGKIKENVIFFLSINSAIATF